MRSDSDSVAKFGIKVIKWSIDCVETNDQFHTPILLQDKNGPCPLIALINTLILQNELMADSASKDGITNELQLTKISRVNLLKQSLLTKASTAGEVTLQYILGELGDLILFYNQHNPVNLEIDALLDRLPSLHTGLNVNPNLISGLFQGDDLASVLFSLFELKFRHGWTIDQVESDQCSYHDANDDDGKNIKDSYSELVEMMYKLKNFDAVQDYLLSDDASPEVLSTQRRIRKWLDSNKTQLTRNGLDRLNMDLYQEEFIVFFRNNHFSTLFKKADSELYLLITDASFTSKSGQIIWQSLNSISGKDDIFFSGSFFPILDIDQDVPHDDYGNTNDMLLVRQLQEEEDAKLAEKMQAKYNSRPQASSSKKAQPPKNNGNEVKTKKHRSRLWKNSENSTTGTSPGTNTSASASATAPSSSKKDDKCCIV
jgi:hypothetical protein